MAGPGEKAVGASEVEPRRLVAMRDRGDPSGGQPTTPSQPGPAIGSRGFVAQHR